LAADKATGPLALLPTQHTPSVLFVACRYVSVELESLFDLCHEIRKFSFSSIWLHSVTVSASYTLDIGFPFFCENWISKAVDLFGTWRHERQVEIGR